MPDRDWWAALWPDPEAVIGLLGVKPAMTVVDLCCGDGYFTAPVARIVHGKVYGVDIDPVLLDQVDCRFDQHVIVVPVGTTLEYLNSDTVSHNVHTYSRKNKPFNRTLPAGVSYKEKVTHAESIPIRCDIHPWMRAYVYAVDTNYAALTDEHGAFEIKGLPPGEYTIVPDKNIPIPFPESQKTHVSVPADAFVEVTIRLDTGMK